MKEDLSEEQGAKRGFAGKATTTTCPKLSGMPILE